jgi:hypothetical protein
MKRLFLLTIVCLGLLTSCVQYDPVYTDDLDLVITNYDKEFSFNSGNTFAIPDSVVLVDGSEFDGSDNFANPSYGDTIIGRIKSNMIARGWTLVDKNNNPDVIILPTVSTTTVVDIYYSYGYWGWYYPGYIGGWGWYYPWWGFPLASTYKTGTLMIQMTDPKDAGTSNNLPVVWVSIINGLMEGRQSSYNTRITTTIDQAFTQSPYINNN